MHREGRLRQRAPFVLTQPSLLSVRSLGHICIPEKKKPLLEAVEASDQREYSCCWSSPCSAIAVTLEPLHSNGEKMDDTVSHGVKVVLIDTAMGQLLCVQESCCKIANGNHREHYGCWCASRPSIQSTD